MREPEEEKDAAVWKALDAFGEAPEPHPQTRARFWARVAREQASLEQDVTRPSRLLALLRVAMPISGLAAILVALLIGAAVLVERLRADREIAGNLELYQNYEVIQNMPQLASYDDPDDDVTDTEAD